MAQVVLKCSNNQSGDDGTPIHGGYLIDGNGNYYKDDMTHLFRDFGESLNSLGSEYKRLTVHSVFDEDTRETDRRVANHALHLRVFDKFYPAWKNVFRNNYPDKYSDSTWNAADNMISRLVAKNPPTYQDPSAVANASVYGWADRIGGSVTDWCIVSNYKIFGATKTGTGQVDRNAPYDILPTYAGHRVSTGDTAFNAFATGVCAGIDRTTNWQRRNTGGRIPSSGG